MKKIYTLLYLLAIAPMMNAQIVINEIMQSNIDCLMDDLNEFPDSWVELYNAGSSSVNLNSYKLGISPNPNEAYRLPSYYLASRGLKTVYCDKESGNWHAPFRLESGKGCSVYLFKGTEIVDSIVGLKKQPAPNIAYGRRYNGTTEWGYQSVPTPNKSNSGQIIDRTNILGEPVFSIPGQVFESAHPITLRLSLPEGTPTSAVIRYTNNGSEPTSSSPIFPANGLSINNTCIVKAKIFCNGYLSSRSTVQSYIYLNRKMTLPVVSISTDNKYLNDNKIGIYVEGTYQSGRKNYEFNWRRPISFEFFDAPEKESELNQLCEARIQGGASRGAQIKSLALYANKRFGEKIFDYEFFPEDKPEQTNFKSLILRNAGNDFDYLYMRDAIIQRTMAKHVDVDWQAWRPAIIYINGQYKGIQNIRERSNDHNIYTNYDGLEDVEVIENWWDVKTGDGSLFNSFKSFYANHGMTLADFEEQIDVSEFIDVMIAELYFNNLDAPGNNFCIWRPTAEGGRWRVILKDIDFTMGLYGDPYNYQILNWVNNADFDQNHNWGANGYDGTRLFRRMMENDDCRNMLIDRCCVYMGDFLNYNGVWEVWQPMDELIKAEYPKHRAQINPWWPNYNDERTNAQNWLRNRTSFFYNHLCSYYNAGSPMTLQVNKGLTSDDLEKIKVTINDIPLSKNTFDGKMPQNREVRLSGENVAQWVMTTYTSANGLQKKTYQGPTLTFNMPNCQYVKIEAVVGDPQGIDQIMTEVDEKQGIGLYDINGRKQSHLHKGMNIIVNRQGDKIVRQKVMLQDDNE